MKYFKMLTCAAEPMNAAECQVWMGSRNQAGFRESWLEEGVTE